MQSTKDREDLPVAQMRHNSGQICIKEFTQCEHGNTPNLPKAVAYPRRDGAQLTQGNYLANAGSEETPIL